MSPIGGSVGPTIDFNEAVSVIVGADDRSAAVFGRIAIGLLVVRVAQPRVLVPIVVSSLVATSTN